jgi:hypothetical protein
LGRQPLGGGPSTLVITSETGDRREIPASAMCRSNYPAQEPRDITAFLVHSDDAHNIASPGQLRALTDAITAGGDARPRRL